jgi:UDPglucose 6-dehydrogenase
MNISFIGLGKLGLPLACCLAESGHNILGVDKNEYILDSLNKKTLPFFESGLSEIFDKVKTKFLGFTNSYGRAIEETDCSIILVNTQLGDDGYSADFVESALMDIALNLKNSTKSYHLIVLSSTILPGTIVKKLIPLIEQISGRKYQEGFGFSYVPDFVRLGSVIHDFKNPEFCLIGANSDKDFDDTIEIFSNFYENDPEIFKCTLEETEIAKVSLNAYIVNKITFANFLGALCDGIHNVNVHNITNVIGIDKRISPYFFKSGTPYGGTCFPRDTGAFIKFAKDRKYSAKNLIFSEEVNEIVYGNIVKKVSEYNRIGILGVSFKDGSPVTVGSPSMRLIKELCEIKKTVYAFDKLSETFDGIYENVIICEDPQECINKSEIIIIMHYDKSFGELDFSNKIIIDNWGILKK